MQSFVIVVVAILGLASAHKTGAPLDACSDLTPKHPTSTADNVTITLEPHQTCYKAASKIMVNISAEGKEIEGILAMAKKSGDTTDNAVGEWKTGPMLKTIDCFNQSKSAITHSDELKTYGSVGLVWTAPQGLTDDVIFRATVVHEEDKYWIDRKSAPLSYDANCENKDYDVPAYVDKDGNPRDNGKGNGASSVAFTLSTLSVIILPVLTAFM